MKIKDILKGIRNKRNIIKGYVYASYVTVQSISVISSNFPKKSLSLKYSTNDINSNYCSKITIEK